MTAAEYKKDLLPQHAALLAAINYASRGWPVVPLHWTAKGRCGCGKRDCSSPGKHPRTPHGVKDATTDEATIRGWWQEWPRANVGVAAGQASGVIALDVDPRHGGDTSLADLESQKGMLPETVESLTGGGGKHLLFKHPGVHVPNKVGIAAGIDVRGDGGYIVVPPSIHVSGRQYVWELTSNPDQAPIAEAPRWLLDMMLNGNRDSRRREDQLGKRIPMGQRNMRLTSLAGSMRRRGMTESEILAALSRVNEERCDPPLPDAEVERIGASVSRYKPAERNERQTEHTALPRVIVNNRPIRDVTHDVVRGLESANDPPVLFVRSGALTRVRTDEQDRPIIDAMTESQVRGRIARVSDCIRATDKGDRDVAPPLDVVRDVLALGEWPFPALEGVTEVPVIRPDGSVLDAPGYDPITHLIYVPAVGLKLPPVPERPTHQERAAALGLVSEVIGDFPFADDASLANTVGLLLTAVLRPAICGPVPLALLDKPQPGTGASLLAEVVALIATGRNAGMLTAPKEDEEWRKKITAALLTGATMITIDNIAYRLVSPSLSAALTASVWEDRVLGRSEIARLPQRATWAATGNNIRLGGDLPRRCYWVRMDAKLARPWERTGFRHPHLRAWVREHRGQVVTALLTLARGWFVAGCPKAEVPTLGGFEEWANTVGGVLAHAGVEGFLKNLDALYDQVDEEGPAWEGFLKALHEIYAEEPVTVAGLAVVLRQEGSALRRALPEDLAETLDDKPGRFERRLGKAFAKRADVRHGDLRLERAGEDTHEKVALWRVRGMRGFAGFPYPTRKNLGKQQEEEVKGAETNPPNPANPPPDGTDGRRPEEEHLKADRAFLLDMARSSNWPELPFKRGQAVAAGEEAWCAFARTADEPNLITACRVLESRQPYEQTREGSMT